MSMISNLIDRLYMASEDYVQFHVGNLLREAAITIKELSAKLNASQMQKSSEYYNNGWIPCEERLPDESGIYICTIHRIIDDDDWVQQLIFEGNPKRWYWDENDFEVNEKIFKILAWQPMPEPYRRD